MEVARNRPSILFVDDETRVVESLATLLRRQFDVHLAASGAEALQKVREIRGLAVIVSDMRMPNMDGAELLHEMTRRCPDATRILLTGHAEAEAAKRAVNQGQIFRFLTKPCPIEELRQAIDAAVTQHRLTIAERAVLRETLIGSIRALMEILAISNPVAFGRASGIKRMALELAAKLGYPEFWQLEAAALLSQLGYLSLPSEVAEKVYYGKPLSAAEQKLAGGAPNVAKKLFEHIPRLEPVMQLLAAVSYSDEQIAALGEGPIGSGARVLALALECDALSSQGKPREFILASIRAKAKRYGAKVLVALEEYLGATPRPVETREVPLRQVEPGMIIQQDVQTSLGVMLVPKGFEVTPSFLERISHFSSDVLDQRVKVQSGTDKT
jgi:CheY-like chemotaxis protein